MSHCAACVLTTRGDGPVSGQREAEQLQSTELQTLRSTTAGATAAVLGASGAV